MYFPVNHFPLAAASPAELVLLIFPFAFKHFLICFHIYCSMHLTLQLVLYLTSYYGNLQSFNSIIMVFVLSVEPNLNA